MSAEQHALTAPEYIGHHLRHLQNFSEKQAIVDWNYINIDSIFWSVVMGALAVFMLWRAARKATSGVPGRFQAAVEMLVEMVEERARAVTGVRRQDRVGARAADRQAAVVVPAGVALHALQAQDWTALFVTHRDPLTCAQCDVDRRLGTIVDQQPSVSQRTIKSPKIVQASSETAADVRFWNRTSSFRDTFADAFDAERLGIQK